MAIAAGALISEVKPGRNRCSILGSKKAAKIAAVEYNNGMAQSGNRERRRGNTATTPQPIAG